MIIQCPSCSTKFAVDSSQLADVENPRFHCSRCDHFFESPELSTKPASSDTPVESAETPVEPVPSAEPGIQTAPDREESGMTPQQLSLIESQFGVPAASSGNAESPLITRSAPPPESIPESYRTLQSQIEVEVVRSAQELEAERLQEALIADRASSDTAPAPAAESEYARPPLGSPEARANAERVSESSRSFDIEEAPFIRADWPEGGTDTVYEADLSGYRAEIATNTRDEQDLDSFGTFAEERRTVGEELDDTLPDDEADTASRDLSASDDLDDSWETDDELIDETEEWEAASAEIEDPIEEDSFADDSLEEILPDDFEDDILNVSKGEAPPPAAAAPLSSAAVSFPAAAAPQSFGSALSMTARPEEIWQGTAPQQAPIERKSAGNRKARPWLPKGLGTVSSVPLLMMLGVWWWSAHLESTPESIRHFLRLDSVGLPQLAPRGLEAVDLRSELITLDDGSKVLEIRGNIVNATANPFQRVKIEAKIFDQHNHELGRLLVDQQAAFAEARLEALSAKVLTSMQEEEAPIVVRLNPNDRIPFRIVFTNLNTDIDLTAAQWFSTRIYSTEKIIS